MTGWNEKYATYAEALAAYFQQNFPRLKPKPGEVYTVKFGGEPAQQVTIPEDFPT